MTIARGTVQSIAHTEGQTVHGQQVPSSNMSQSQQQLQSAQTNVPQVMTQAVQPQDENGETGAPPPEYQQPEFPVAELARLDEMVNRTRWVVPVLPKSELEVLLDASIALCKRGRLDDLFIIKLLIVVYDVHVKFKGR